MDNDTLAALANALISVPQTPGASNPMEGLKGLLMSKIFGQQNKGQQPQQPQQMGGLGGLFGLSGVPGMGGNSNGG